MYDSLVNPELSKNHFRSKVFEELKNLSLAQKKKESSLDEYLTTRNINVSDFVKKSPIYHPPTKPSTKAASKTPSVKTITGKFNCQFQSQNVRNIFAP